MLLRQLEYQNNDLTVGMAEVLQNLFQIIFLGRDKDLFNSEPLNCTEEQTFFSKQVYCNLD